MYIYIIICIYQLAGLAPRGCLHRAGLVPGNVVEMRVGDFAELPETLRAYRVTTRKAGSWACDIAYGRP